jgi:hypothetical protein
MQVRFARDWQDDDGIIYRAGDVINVDASTASALAQGGIAQPLSAPADPSRAQDGWGKGEEPD